MSRFLAVAACLLSLTGASAAFAQTSGDMGNGQAMSHDAMGKDNGTAAGGATMSHDGMGNGNSAMSHDNMSNGSAMSSGAMSHSSAKQ
ncbi:hypothetical protein [Acidocella sp.]|uniref:hypothetical protein n=1 Tax=Acidocella sp. TaxID=50710 RepID=UPI003D018508